MPRKASPPPPPPPPQERDYLVIYEEPDPYGLPADDTLVLDIEQPNPGRSEVDVQQKVQLELSNTTSRLGTFGFSLCTAGAVLGVILMVWFARIYPFGWHGDGASNRALILLSALALVCMIIGTVLTHYGRRIRAHGRLSDVRIIEKVPQGRASLE
jgi:hypothetical protein